MLGFAPVDNEVAAAFSQSSGNLLTNPTAGAGDSAYLFSKRFIFYFPFKIETCFAVSHKFKVQVGVIHAAF